MASMHDVSATANGMSVSLYMATVSTDYIFAARLHPRCAMLTMPYRGVRAEQQLLVAEVNKDAPKVAIILLYPVIESSDIRLV